MITTVFWSAIGLVVLVYVGFPLMLFVRQTFWQRPFRRRDSKINVSIIIAAYNEAECIGERINNIRSQKYPQELIEIVIASDGSDDETESIVRQQIGERLKLLPLPRGGKATALNAAIKQATGEVVVFSDANSHFDENALSHLVAPFADPEVGGVAGNQIYQRDEQASATADGECSYWDFDRLQKQWQSKAGSVTSATGSIYAIRRELYAPIPSDAMDDFFVSTGVIAKGLRLVFASDAKSYEPVATARGVEFSRKLRVVGQGLKSVWYRRSLLNPFRFGFYSLQLGIHKVLRRVMVFPLLVIFMLNFVLWREGPTYQILLVSQCAMLVLALLGASLSRLGIRPMRTLLLPYYFLVVNLAALIAVTRLLSGQKIRLWNPERHGGSSDPAPEQV